MSTVIGSLYVPLVAVLAWALLRERPSRGYLATLPVVVAGIMLASGIVGASGTGHHPGRGLAYGLAANIAYVGYLLTLRHAAGDTRHVAGQLFDATETICRWADIKLRVLQRRSLWPWPPRRKRPEPTGNIGPNVRSSGRPRQACRPIRAADAPPTRCPLTSANVG